jgi:hypothetical protein
VPAGRPAIQRGYRVYDESRLLSVFPRPSLVRWFMKRGREHTWIEADAPSVADLVYEHPFGEAPAQGVAIIVCDKPGVASP